MEIDTVFNPEAIGILDQFRTISNNITLSPHERAAQLIALDTDIACGTKSLSEYPSSEIGQAEAFADIFKNWLKWTPGRLWLAYDRQTGTFQETFGASLAKGAARRLAYQRQDMRHASDYKEAEKFARACQTNRSLEAVLSIARDIPGLRADDNAFDASPYYLNCAGIVIDLRVGLSSARQTTPEDLFTRSTGVRPEPGDTPIFSRFLEQITCNRPDLSAWLLRWFAYSLTGDMRAPFFVNLWGGGRNGKGALLRLMRFIAGGYGTTVSSRVVLDTGNISGPRPDLVALMGPRLGEVAEIPPGRLAIETIKQLTGGDPITADKKHMNPIEFIPQVKLTLVSNHRLEVRHVDTATARRFRLVPFDFEVPEGEEDPTLEDRLRVEAPQILSMLIDEAVKYYQTPGPKGFPTCPTIETASAEYLASEDLVGRFLDERTIRTGHTSASVLYRSFVEWTEREGIVRPPSPRTFAEDLTGKKIEKKRSSSGNYYQGVSIKPDSEV